MKILLILHKPKISAVQLGWLTFISMTLKRFRKGVLLLFFSVLTFHAYSQSYNLHNFNSENGLAQSYVYSIMQDARGYLWVGTGNGLSRYNGFKFENFTTSDSLADNFITSSISDGECMWFGHMNGRITYFNGKKFHAVYMPQPNVSPITHFAKSPDGQIWVSTYSDGLLKLNHETSVVKYNFIKDQTLITSFDFLNDSELLIGTNTGLLYCKLKDSGKIELIRPVLEIPESKIMCIIKMRNKSGFYIATENDGIFRINHDGGLFKVSKVIADQNFNFTFVQDIYEDNQSNLWICTFGNGIFKLNYSSSGELTKINYFNYTNGFATNNVKTVFEDLEGNIWSGNYGEGLTQLKSKTFSVYTFDEDFYGNDIFSIYFNQQYRWIGTEKGLLKLDQLTGDIVAFYGEGSGLPKDKVTTIYSTDGKELWIGTEKNGVFRMETENEKIHKYPIGTGTLENSITTIIGKKEQVWIGTKKGLCSINSDTHAIKWYSISQGGLPHNFVNCLYLDRKDRLWVSTSSSILAYIKDEEVFKIPINSVNKIFTLGPIIEDTDSLIWVGSTGNGVFMIGSDSIANITTKEGLLSDYCYSLLCDDNKNIWIGHKGGLSRIRKVDFSVKPIQYFEDISESYQFNPNAIIKDQQGKIWFGSDKGIVCYDQSMENSHIQPPVLGITSIKVNDEEIVYTHKIILSPGNYKIRIDYMGISLKEPTLVNYQYKLEGYDQWSEITKNTSTTYNLTEGDYTFILKASNGDGIISENPLTLNIIIKKPVWKKWWFYPANAILLIILTFVYIKKREYGFLVEKRILEEKVQQRTFEIQSQKNEIELQRDIIDKKNEHITSSIQYALHIQNAILPPSDLIGELLPDNFILSRPKDIVSGDFYWLTEKDNKIIFTVADCTGHGVPGAFMSLLGITFLNSIVNIEGITKSDDIVTKLRKRVINSLQQSRKIITSTVGMDIVLCVLDKSIKSIQYTGGMNDLVYIRDKKLEIIKADRFSVGAMTNKISRPFTMKEIEYKEGDIFYLFSDGYKDQFGGDQESKYLRRKFYASLLEIHELPMSTQKEILDKKLNEWMKDYVQTDDITVMGIRL